MGKRSWKKKAGAYDRIDTIADIRKYVKRNRRTHMVILSERFVKKQKPNCVRCGKRITVKKGNRTNISPRGRVTPMCYSCAWGNVFDGITKLSNAYRRGVFDIMGGKAVKLPRSVLDR